MVAIVCTIIVCITVLLCVNIIAKISRDILMPAQQEGITQEDLEKAYKENKSAPNFQDVVDYINKEFMGIETEDNDE